VTIDSGSVDAASSEVEDVRGCDGSMLPSSLTKLFNRFTEGGLSLPLLLSSINDDEEDERVEDKEDRGRGVGSSIGR
jgi:hypothetical protein